MPNSVRFASVILALSVAGIPAYSAPLAWQIGEGAHPTLGSIRFASPQTPITTPVGSAKISSRAYVSCVRSSNRIAIELAHATAPDDPGGLQPKTLPILLCNKPAGAGRQSELPARWAISEIGDVLARGFEPQSLRECASIHVVQDVALPGGWARDSARVRFDIDLYSKELDSIFVTCGEASAYGPATPATPLPVAPWKTARTISGGKSNLRAKPSTASAVVAQLPAATTVLVQQAEGGWWRVRSAGRVKFGGYIREDRLVFR